MFTNTAVKDIAKIEENVSSESPKRGFFLFASLIILAAGVVLSYQGYQMFTGGDSLFTISADTETKQSPPVPPDPLPLATPITPVKPPDASGSTTISKGWSLVSGETLENVDLDFLTENKIALYSYNDPLYPLGEWTVYPFASSAQKDVKPRTPLGYFLYNSGEEVSLDLVTKKTDELEQIFARGWHLLYWPNESADKNALMDSVQIEYSNGTKLSLTQAASAEIHSASSKIYVIDCKNGVSCGGFEEFSATGLGSTAKISKGDFFWIYLRRTRVRAVDISIDTIN